MLILTVSDVRQEDTPIERVAQDARDYLLSDHYDKYLPPINYLDIVAEKVTGWGREQAVECHIVEVFHINAGATRDVARNPLVMALDLKSNGRK
jgi:hypothetical protein